MFCKLRVRSFGHLSAFAILRSVADPAGAALRRDTQATARGFLQHRPARMRRQEALSSKYRTSSREIPNEGWNRADPTYHGAMLKLQREQIAVVSAEARSNNKMIEHTSTAIEEPQQKVTNRRTRFNSTGAARFLSESSSLRHGMALSYSLQ